MWTRRGAVVLGMAAVPVLAAGAWAAASSIETRPAPQVVVPPDSAVPHSTSRAPTSTSVDDDGGRHGPDDATTSTSVDDHGERRGPGGSDSGRRSDDDHSGGR